MTKPNGHVEERLSAYLDGELPEAERAEVAAHLDSCPDCAEILAEMSAVDAVARGLPVRAPDGYFEALPARVREKLERRARRRVVPVWGWAAAAAVLLAVLTPLTLRQTARSEADRLTEASRPRPKAVPPVAAPAAPPREEQADRKTADAATAEPTRPIAEREAPVGGSRTQAPSRAQAFRRTETASSPVASESDEAFAAAPATPPPARAAAPPPPAASLIPSDTRDLAKAAVAPERTGRVAGGIADRPAAASEATAREDLDALAPPRTLAEARRQRELWRRRAASVTEAVAADAALVRVVELGVAAFRLGGLPEDRTVARADAEAYLARTDARQTEHIRDLLGELDD